MDLTQFIKPEKKEKKKPIIVSFSLDEESNEALLKLREMQINTSALIRQTLKDIVQTLENQTNN